MALNKEKVIAAAQKYVEKGQYDKAIKEYLKVVQEDAKDVRIWLKIGDLYAKKGANGEAVETYEKVAGTYSEQGFYLKAVAVYKQILKLEPRKVDVNLRLAELYKQLGLLSDAMQQFELASNVLGKEGKTRESLDALKQMVEMEPENVASRIKLAESYSKEGLNQQAIEEFRKAADQLKTQNRTEDFIKVAERLAWHKPDDQELAKELATLYIRRQDPRRALTKLQQCFKADPRDVVTLELLAEAFQALGQNQKTLSVLKELAKVLHETGRMAERDNVYKRILDMEPEDTEARQALGIRKGGSRPPRATEFLQAIEHQEEAISAEIDEEALGAHMAAPEVEEPEIETGAAEFIEEADIEDAVAVEEEIEIGGAAGTPAIAPEPAGAPESFEDEIARTLTETDVFIKYGLHDKATEHLQRVFERDPNHFGAHEKLKDLHVAAGRTGDAISELLWLAEATRDARPEDAAQYLREALDLDATNTRARTLLQEVTGQDAPEQLRPEIADALGVESPSSAETPAAFDEELPAEALGDVEPLGDEIEVEEPTNQVDANDFEEEVSSAIELYPDEIEFEEPIEAQPFAGDLDPKTDHTPPPETLSAEEEMPRFGTPPVETAAPERKLTEPPPDAPDYEGVGIEDELEEADFFVTQGLADQAREILEELLGRYPGHPLVLAKLRDLGGAVSEPSVTAADDEPRRDDDEPSQAEVLELSRRAVVDKQIGEEDFDTHYDLGIAYKEMGLYDDAIHEFKMVMKAPGKEVLCHTMIGLCYSEKGMQTEAISQFKKALYVEGITEREQLSLYFELGVAYEKLQDWREGLYYYEKVAKKDGKFRDVERRVSQMKSHIGGSGAQPGNGRGANGNGHAPGGEDVEDAFDGIMGEEAET